MNSDFIFACPAKGLKALQPKLILKAVFQFPLGVLPVGRESTNPAAMER
jgi:hypothetical protein